MKKFFLVTHKMSAGGCERVISLILKRFDAEGVACTLITECRTASFYALPENVRILPLGDGPDLPSREIPRAYKKLRRLVKTEKPDLVLAMPEKVNVWTVLFLLGTGVPVVVSERNDPRRHPENRIKRFLRRVIYPFAAGFIFQTADAAAYFPKRIQKRGIILPNPLDVSRLPAPCSGERKKRVVAAGRLHEQKNFALLIRAFCRFYATHPDYTLTIYGEGSERKSLELLASQKGVTMAVRLPGETDALLNEMNESAMFALSSDYEGMPNVLIEAMACGLPCVATDCPVGGAAALITNEENGLLVPVGAEKKLAKAMSRIADDADLAQKLGENAASIRERLDEARVLTEWRRYFERIAEQ